MTLTASLILALGMWIVFSSRFRVGQSAVALIAVIVVEVALLTTQSGIPDLEDCLMIFAINLSQLAIVVIVFKLLRRVGVQLIWPESKNPASNV